MDKARMTRATWRQLEAQGVSRCRAFFTDGKQCRCRATFKGTGFSAHELTYCAKHAGIFNKAQALS